MSSAQLVHVGPDRFRVVPWHGDGAVALVAPVPGAPPPRPDGVRRCVEVLADRGVHEVVTGALAAPEQPAFLAAGFAVREHLHLLSHDLRRLPVAPDLGRTKLRRARRGDRAAALAVDAAAFDEFWRLDAAGLADAIDATTTARFRVAADRQVVGYQITGRAGNRGYLQRLAVDPTRQRGGVATALVADGLHWLRRHGVGQVVVNTQERNAAALSLYEHLGFRRLAQGLDVLARPTAAPA